MIYNTSTISRFPDSLKHMGQYWSLEIHVFARAMLLLATQSKFVVFSCLRNLLQLYPTILSQLLRKEG